MLVQEMEERENILRKKYQLEIEEQIRSLEAKYSDVKDKFRAELDDAKQKEAAAKGLEKELRALLLAQETKCNEAQTGADRNLTEAINKSDEISKLREQIKQLEKQLKDATNASHQVPFEKGEMCA